MKNYYRIMLGKGSIFAEEAYKANFIGAGWFEKINLTNKLPDNWREFNKEFIPIYLKEYPDKTKVAAGLACGMLWTITNGIQQGDIVLCPDGKGSYYVGEVIGDYEYHKEQNVPHRRPVRWYPKNIKREEMSESLKNATGAIGTVSNIISYAEEIESLISGSRPQAIITTDETIEDPYEFVMEKHLESFLVKNWKFTELGKHYDIYQGEEGLIGEQYQTDTGLIDILAISKDKKELVVIELKKGRVSDVVVGQVLRYMGYVKEELAETNQTVKGIIIGFEDDLSIKRALSVAPNIDFYTYKIHFELKKK